MRLSARERTAGLRIVNVPRILFSTGSFRSFGTHAGAIAVFDGGAAVLTTGIALDLPVPFACTITEVNMYSQQTGSLVIDVWKDTHGNFPPTVADSITAAAKPTITASNKSQDSDLTGWDTTINAGDILRFNIDSVSSIQRATLILEVERT